MYTTANLHQEPDEKYALTHNFHNFKSDGHASALSARDIGNFNCGSTLSVSPFPRISRTIVHKTS